jgi:PIN domain nuclease of toxin-antitoxin system
MRVMLDTHAFLWFVGGDSNLSATARAAITDPNNVVLLSPASHWEIAIKVSTGKLTLAEPFDVFMLREIQQNGFEIFPIEVAHTAVVATLPFHYRDPFDRLLVAQALSEGVPLVSADPVFDSYGVTRMW